VRTARALSAEKPSSIEIRLEVTVDEHFCLIEEGSALGSRSIGGQE
jgi:hypothetical protein